jgi:hypothetical protein
VKIEQDLRSRVIAGMGVAVGAIFLKPPKWIVKSTAGKPARSSTLEKLLKEHPEFDVSWRTELQFKTSKGEGKIRMTANETPEQKQMIDYIIRRIRKPGVKHRREYATFFIRTG